MNILLIDKRVSRYEDIVAAIDPVVAVAVVFDYFEDTFDTVKARMRALGLSGTSNSVGLIQHNYKAPMFSMLASADIAPVLSVASQDPDLARWTQFRDFIVWCKTEFSIAHFDMMACALYSDTNWKYVIDTLATQTGVEIRASTDNTGSATLGGNWFLESHTGVNLKGVYFTELIEEYRGVLFLDPYGISSTKGVATGSVVAWGDSNYAGNTTDVSNNLTSGVVSIYSTSFAFAALKTDGSVQVWGDTIYGGNTNYPLSNGSSLDSGVVSVYSTTYAFAALKTGGSIVTWGQYIGNIADVSNNLSSDVVAVQSTVFAFAALKTDGSVVTWGHSSFGGSDPGITGGVVAIYSNNYAFAALKNDGSVVAWGNSYFGGADPGITGGVVAVYSSMQAFAALKTDGSVVAWGNPGYGGTTPNITGYVVAIYSTERAFAALKNDGSVVAWGDSSYGGTDPGITGGVVAVYSNGGAFAALKTNGSVQTWGFSDYGGDSTTVASDLSSGVVAVYSTWAAFAALKNNGRVITWGYSYYGSDSSTVASNLSSDVVAVYSTGSSFAALKSDGSVVAWGDSLNAGNTTDVSNNLTSGVVAVYSSGSAFAALKTDAVTFDISMSYYTDMDRYDILRKKENRRRVDLTTLNNNVFTLSAARDIQSFNPAIPSGNTLRIIVPDYVASSYSITSTATIPNSAGSFIVACDEGEPVTISGSTYVNFGSFVYKRETDNTYTKLTSTTINGRSYALYGGDGTNSSGIAFVSNTPPETTHWASGTNRIDSLVAYGSYMYAGRRIEGLGINRYNLSDGSLDTENWVDGVENTFTAVRSMAIDSSDPANPYLYAAVNAMASPALVDPTNILKISLIDASIISSDWAPSLAPVSNIAIYGAFMYAVDSSNEVSVIRKLSLVDGSVVNANFATINASGDYFNGITMNIDDAGTYMYVMHAIGKISKISMSTGSIVDADWINIPLEAPFTYGLDTFVIYGPSIYAMNYSNGNIVQINLASRTITDAAWATLADWDVNNYNSYIAMTVFGSSLYVARADIGVIDADIGVIDKFALPAVSNICFPASAPVQTDQGIVAIARLDPTLHTVEGMRIVDVTKTVTNDSFLVRIGRDALGKDYPTQDTVISRLHKLEYGGRMVAAEWFVGQGFTGVERIPYLGESLYNVMLAEPRTMRVNNLICETLLPSSPIAKLYARSSRYTEYTRDIILSLLKTHKASNNREAYRKVLSSL